MHLDMCPNIGIRRVNSAGEVDARVATGNRSSTSWNAQPSFITPHTAYDSVADPMKTLLPYKHVVAHITRYQEQVHCTGVRTSTQTTGGRKARATCWQHACLAQWCRQAYGLQCVLQRALWTNSMLTQHVRAATTTLPACVPIVVVESDLLTG